MARLITSRCASIRHRWWMIWRSTPRRHSTIITVKLIRRITLFTFSTNCWTRENSHLPTLLSMNATSKTSITIREQNQSQSSGSKIGYSTWYKWTKMIAALSNIKHRCSRPRKTSKSCAIRANPSIGSTKNDWKRLKRYLKHRKMKLYVRKQKMLCFSTKYMSINIIRGRKGKRSMAFTQLNSRVHIIKNLYRSPHLLNISQWMTNIRAPFSTSVFKMTQLCKVKIQWGPKTSCKT